MLGRIWTFEIYPESVDPKYVDILNELHIQWCESPVHNMDVTQEGEHKKDHIHIVLKFEGNKSYKQYKEIAESVKGVPAPEHTAHVESIRGMVRYLIHLDNPEKAQYERENIKTHGGMDIEEYFMYPASLVKLYLAEIIQFIDAEGIEEYCDLLSYACKEYYDTWYDLLTIGHQSFVVCKYLDSKRNSRKQREKEMNGC